MLWEQLTRTRTLGGIMSIPSTARSAVQKSTQHTALPRTCWRTRAAAATDVSPTSPSRRRASAATMQTAEARSTSTQKAFLRTRVPPRVASTWAGTSSHVVGTSTSRTTVQYHQYERRGRWQEKKHPPLRRHRCTPCRRRAVVPCLSVPSTFRQARRKRAP